MAALSEPNFVLFTCKARKFSMSSLVTFSILTNQINDGFLCDVIVTTRDIAKEMRRRKIGEKKHVFALDFSFPSLR